MKFVRIGGFIALFLAPSPCFAQANPDLTIRARAVLRKYCAECHHPGDGQRGQISVLDRPGLDRTERPFLAPGSAKTSQLLQLMEEGSMPPGNRPKPTKAERQIIEEWITANAASFPQQFDSAYVMSAILANVRPLPEGDRQNYRYFSLHNVILDADPAFSLEPMREALRRAVAGLSKNGTTIDPIDAAQSVFRVNLRQAGWDMKPYERKVVVDGQTKPREPSGFDLFDLILIEYPHGRLDTTSAVGREFTDAFLKPIPQAMPVAFVRADWFVEEFSHSPVARDFASALDLQPAAGAAKVFPAPKPDANDRGKKLLPLDSVLARNTPSDDAPLQLVFETRDSATKQPKTKFAVGERFDLHIRPSARAFVEVFWHAVDGTVGRPNLGAHHLIDAGQSKFPAGPTGQGYRVAAGPPGKEYLTIFASEQEFPPADQLVIRENVNTRVSARAIHPFFTLPGVRAKFRADASKFEFDPAKVVKKTIEIEILPMPK